MLDIWLIKTYVPEERLKLQASEVAQAKWVTTGELKEMIKNGEYHNYGQEYFSVITDTVLPAEV